MMLALVAVCAFLLTLVDAYPSLPLLVTLLLFPVLQRLVFSTYGRRFHHHTTAVVASLAHSQGIKGLMKVSSTAEKTICRDSIK
jgi:hypothetical protein